MKKVFNFAVRLIIVGMTLASFFCSGASAATQSPLMPSDVAVEDVAVLSKTAVRTSADSWEVTLKVTAKERVAPEPIELVILMDVSGSMAWCTDSDHEHGRGGEACDGVAATQSRQYLAGAAAKQLVSGLARKGVELSAAVTVFSGWPIYNDRDEIIGYTDTASVERAMGPAVTENELQQVLDAIPTSGARGATCLCEGITLAGEQFTDSANKKVLVVLTDGEYNSTNPTSAAEALKAGGVSIWTIGFLHEDPALEGLASGGCYLTADSASELANAFEEIAHSISAMVVDPMGDNFVIDASSVTASGKRGAVTVNNNTLYWTSTSPFAAGDALSIKYSVSLDEIALGDNNGIYDLVPLNKKAEFVYSINGGSARRAEFPIPRAHYEVGELTISWQGLPAAVTPSPIVETLISDFGSESFEVAAPLASYTDGGDSFGYVGSAYDSSEETMKITADTELPASAGAHTLVHRYEQTYSLVYLDGVDGEDIPVPPSVSGIFALENVELSDVKPRRDGYLFRGWRSNTGTTYAAGATLVMPAADVELTAVWQADIPSTGDSRVLLWALCAVFCAAAIFLAVKKLKSK